MHHHAGNKKASRTTPLEAPEETSSGPSVIEEDSNTGEMKETNNEIGPTCPLEILDLGLEGVKEGGNQEIFKEESATDEEEEEEGEIDMATLSTKKARGRKSTKEVREQATYKDKLQGSQLTLEKLLRNTRNTR